MVMRPEEPVGWFPLPAEWVFRDRRVVTRRAHEDVFAWFPVPDPSGYVGIGLALLDKTDVAREFWMWTDDSEERAVRIVRLGYRRYVVEIHGVDGCFVIEDPARAADERPLGDDERMCSVGPQRRPRRLSYRR